MKQKVVTVIVAAIAMFVAQMVIGPICMKLFPSLEAVYANEALFRPMNAPQMQLVWIFPLIVAGIGTWLWNKTKSGFTGTTFARGMRFGFFLWVVMILSGMIMTYATFQLPFTVVLSWAVNNLVMLLVGGWVIVKMSK